ncbi:unnamed protein product [Alopecurus aequalis]
MGSNLRGSIRVTFCPVAPPLVSYLCFHATDMDHTEFAIDPQIITTETNGGLVLLKAVVGDDPSDCVLTSNAEYLVYDARAAKLDHLPHPGRQHEFDDYTLAIVRKCKQHCTSSSRDHDCTYVIVAQSLRFGGPQNSHLCMYHSDTQTWSNKPVVLEPNSYPWNLITSKTLTVGGTVAWVDLWQGILFCDVLDEQPKLRFLKLPKAIVPRKTARLGDPRSVRDIALVGNPIKFVEMHVHFDRYSKTSRRWKTTTWSIRTGSFSPEDWTMDHLINSTQLIPAQPSLLHKLKVGTAGIKRAGPDPTLSTLHVGLPNISLQDDAIVYFLAKIDYRDSRHAAWVLALDMSNMTVKEVEPFKAERTLGLARDYDASRMSAYP